MNKRKRRKIGERIKKERIKAMLMAKPLLLKWRKDAEQIGKPTCVVCGETMDPCLQKHHTDPSKHGKISPAVKAWIRIYQKRGEIKKSEELARKIGGPAWVYLCASCHNIFNKVGTKRGVTAREAVELLKERHKRFKASTT